MVINELKNRAYLKDHKIVVYLEGQEERVYSDILPVAQDFYYGFPSPAEVERYDSFFEKYGNYIVTDIDKNSDSKVVFVYCRERKRKTKGRRS